jgi:chromosomal replication initiator protein
VEDQPNEPADQAGNQSGNQAGEADLEQAWWSVVGELQPNQRAWLEASAPVTLHGNQAIIEVVDEFTRGQLEGRLRAQIEEGLTAVFGREIRLGVTVNPQLVSERAVTATTTPKSHHVDNSTHLPVDTSTY